MPGVHSKRPRGYWTRRRGPDPRIATGMTDPEAVQLATIDWTRGKWSHVKGKYAREHTWHLAGGTTLKATNTAAMLPEGYRDRHKLNPENLFVATVASAPMLSWLHVAFQMGVEVETYRDRPCRTFVAKSRVLMVRRTMEFGVESSMIGCPRIRTSDHAPLAPPIPWADTATADAERARDQRVFHIGSR